MRDLGRKRSMRWQEADGFKRHLGGRNGKVTPDPLWGCLGFLEGGALVHCGTESWEETR